MFKIIICEYKLSDDLVIYLNRKINLFQLDRLYSDSDVGASKTSFCYSLSIQSERQKRQSDEIIYHFKKLFS